MTITKKNTSYLYLCGSRAVRPHGSCRTDADAAAAAGGRPTKLLLLHLVCNLRAHIVAGWMHSAHSVAAGPNRIVSEDVHFVRRIRRNCRVYREKAIVFCKVQNQNILCNWKCLDILKSSVQYKKSISKCWRFNIQVVVEKLVLLCGGVRIWIIV